MFRVLLLLLLAPPLARAATVRFATYNVENYLDQPSGTRPAKSEIAKAKVRESIFALKPDVLALQEIGAPSALLELQIALKTNHLDLPYSEYVTGYDTNIHVAILSRLPIIARQPQTNDAYLLNGSRYLVKRGFGQVNIQASSNQIVTLLVAHLKSKVPTSEASEADIRLEEAKVLRQKIDAGLAANPNLIVLGDLNDTRDSLPLRTIIARGNRLLYDTRPAERNGDDFNRSNQRVATRTIAWTHYYAKDETYSRIDYILLSRDLSFYVNQAETYVLAQPNWGLASDHRPLLVTLTLPDK